jgi:uncharacterized protein YegP (UPF0339 family)
MIEYFLDDDSKNRFRVKGRNGEIVATSEAYANQSNAERGVDDLYLILHADLGGKVDEERPITPTLAGDGSDSGSGGSGTDAESSDAESLRETEGEETLPGDFSRHDEVPHDNPDALPANTDENRPDDGF